MQTSILALLGTVAVFSGCNLSSEVGSNEDDSGGSGGSGGSGTNAGGETSAAGGESSASGGRASGGAGPTSTTTTSTSTGGGPEIQNAHVYVSATTSLGWLGEQTVISIYANPDPLVTTPTGPLPCEAAVVPNQPFDASTYVDLSGARVRVTAPGFGVRDAIWQPESRTLYTSYQQALPAGTPIEIDFDPTSTLFPGQSLELYAQNLSMQAPVIENVLVYPRNTPWLFDWTSDPMGYMWSGFVIPGNLMPPPPASMLVGRCIGDASTSAVTLPASVMGALVSDMESQGQGAQIWMSLSLFDEGPKEQPFAGNFLSVVESVQLSRPVVVEP